MMETVSKWVKLEMGAEYGAARGVPDMVSGGC